MDLPEGMLLLYSSLFIMDNEVLSRGKHPFVNVEGLQFRQVLGGGGSGVVFSAEQQGVDVQRLVAIKLFVSKDEKRI